MLLYKKIVAHDFRYDPPKYIHVLHIRCMYIYVIVTLPINFLLHTRFICPQQLKFNCVLLCYIYHHDSLLMLQLLVSFDWVRERSQLSLVWGSINLTWKTDVPSNSLLYYLIFIFFYITGFREAKSLIPSWR